MIADMGETMGNVGDVNNLWEKCLVREEIGGSSGRGVR